MSNPFHDTVYRTSWPDAQATGLTWQLYKHFWWESRDKDRAWWRCSEVQRMLVESALMRGDTAQADRYLADWKIWKESQRAGQRPLTLYLCPKCAPTCATCADERQPASPKP